jgi:oligopeptide transport system ATP-binding protein
MNTNHVLVRVEDLKKYFPITRGIVLQRTVGQVRAVDGISFSIAAGETLGLVGESGCGKTTAGRTVLGLYPATEGRVWIDGLEVGQAKGESLRTLRQRTQMIFQDPYASLNPRWTVGSIVAEPLRVHSLVAGKQQRLDRVRELLGPQPALCQPLPARVFRRSAAADRDRPGAGLGSGVRGVRRTNLGSGCFDPGSDRQPAGRPAG